MLDFFFEMGICPFSPNNVTIERKFKKFCSVKHCGNDHGPVHPM